MVLSDTSALDITPGAPAAAHSREALAEVANTVCCAETSPDRSRWLQRCGILPVLQLRLRMLCISLTGLLQVLGLGCLVVVPHRTMPAATMWNSASSPTLASDALPQPHWALPDTDLATRRRARSLRLCSSHFLAAGCWLPPRG